MLRQFASPALIFGLLAAALEACDETSDAPDAVPAMGGSQGSEPGDAGPLAGTGGSGSNASAGSGAGGSGGAAGNPSGSAGSGSETAPDVLPIPPGSPVPTPGSASAPNLRVLPWAGFKSAVSYTIDDTQPSAIEHWPELKASGVRMTFYANPSGNWFAGYDAALSEAVALGFELGNHTMTHCRADLTECPSGAMPVGTVEDEIDRCSEYIVSRLGAAGVYTIAYPFGDTGYAALSAPRFLLGRGVSPGLVAASGPLDRYALPVVALAGGETAAALEQSIDGARSGGSWAIFLIHSLLPTTYNWYAGADIGAITESIAYARNSGEVWVDSLINVGAYRVGQQLLEAAIPTESDGTDWAWTLPDHFPPGRVLRITVDGGTLSQGGSDLVWDPNGYYELSLDAGSLHWKP